MTIVIRREPPENFTSYGTVPVAFAVSRVLDVEERGERFTFTERAIEPSFLKDYDAIPENDPANWPRRFSIANWGLFSARDGESWVGAAAIAPRGTDVLSPDVGLDAAVLWDIRVAPANRGKSVGRTLFAAAERWASGAHRRWLIAETQNVNVAACRFYERTGCELVRMDRRVYPEFPDEVRLVWRKQVRLPASHESLPRRADTG